MGPSPGTPARRRAGSTTAVKDWVEQITTANSVNLQQRMVSFLLRAYGASLAATLAIFLLQGWHLWGFNLDAALLKWLGGATIGEIAGLLTLTFGAVFKRRNSL